MWTASQWRDGSGHPLSRREPCWPSSSLRLPRRRRILGSDRRVKGRRSRSRATARRAALEAVAASWTMGAEEDGSGQHRLREPVSPGDLRLAEAWGRCGRTAGSYPVICCASAVAGDDEPVWDVSPQLGRPFPACASRPDLSGSRGFRPPLVTALTPFPPPSPLPPPPGRIRTCDPLL